MALFNKIVRTPNNLNDDIDIEFYSSNEKIYGLSIFLRGAKDWRSYIGTFPFLYGIWVNLFYSNKVISEMNDDLLKFKMDLDNDFYGAIFFNINSYNKPINIIKSFDIGKNKGLNFLFDFDTEEYIKIHNISFIYDQYDEEDDDENLQYNRLPQLIFEI